MKSYPIPKTLGHKYHGSGHALAAVIDGQLVDIIYVRDVLPKFDGNIMAVLKNKKLGRASRYLSALGSVSVGMVSNGEFVEL